MEIETMYEQLGVSRAVYEYGEAVLRDLRPRFDAIDQTAEYNQGKVLHAMQKNRVNATHFAATTGYGYNDDGRDNLERVYAQFPRLKERRKQVAGTLSGGEQQMLAMGRALMSKPKLIVMDEPSMGLSPIFVNEIFDIIRKVSAEGTTVLLVEQNAKKALSIADRAYVLETGQIVLSGKAEDLLKDDSVKKAYLGE